MNATGDGDGDGDGDGIGIGIGIGIYITEAKARAAGFAVVSRAVAHANEKAHVAFPWSATLQPVIVTPIIAGIVAYIGSTVAQAVRPTRMSTFASD